MSEKVLEARSGGCQCGAVRFRVTGPLGNASICHCRMCQKAFGGFYAPFVAVSPGTLAWTRGRPAYFQSSNHVRRGFCASCGTPLTFEAPDGMALAIGAFDAPATIEPSLQYGIEGKLAYVDGLARLPGSETGSDPQACFEKSIVSYQHPDHDTETWPPEGATRP
nr:GFA family protein [Afifella pfennigii]